MKISYAITVCNEFVEIQRLVNFLLQHKRAQDNIVILYDEANGDPEIEAFLRSHSPNKEFAWHKGKFERHFADWKNKLASLCNGGYIFQIDADEIPNENLLMVLPEILELNSEMDMFLVPRVNTVEGLTPEHIAKWGWRVNDEGWVNWPDFQCRIWKNKPELKWKNQVHEVLEGFKNYTALPDVEYFALYHPKDIKKQERAVKLYQTINPNVKEKI
jgi:hypothetical protein